MNRILTILFATIGLAYCMQADAAGNNNKKTVYIFGFASSFNDSTVYFTDIQQLDGVYIGRKNHFLYDRDSYSAQLRDHLSGKGEVNRVCLISFAEKQKDVEKKYMKLKKRYQKGNNYDIKFLSSNEFQFNRINSEEPAPELTKAEQKAEKKKAKIEKKEEIKKAKAEKKANKKERKAKRKGEELAPNE